MKRSVVFALLALSGCAQVLGLGDFVDDDPSAGGGGGTSISTGSTPSTTSSQMMSTSTSGVGGDAQGGGGGTGGMGPDPGDVVWGHGWGATVGETAFDVDVAPNGDIYVAGITVENGTFMIGSTSVTGPALFLVKLSPAGAIVWTRVYPMSGTSWTYPYGIDATDEGVAIAGYVEPDDTIDFGGGFAPRTGVAIAKIGADGSTQWSKSCGGGTNYKANYGGDVVMDSSGNVVVASLTNAPVNCNTSGTGNSGPVVSKLNATGGFMWNRGTGGFGYDRSIRLALDSAGNVLIAGESNGVNFGGGEISGSIAAKIAANGGHIWSKQLTASGFGAEPAAIAATSSDEILIGGRFQNATDFGGGVLTPAGATDAFLVRLGANGNHAESAQFGNSYATIEGIQSLPNGEVLIAGWFGGSMPMGNENLMAQGMFDAFLARVDATFTPNYARRYGGPGIDHFYEIAVGPGQVVATGDYDAAIDFGAVDLMSFGDTDAMVVGIAAP